MQHLRLMRPTVSNVVLPACIAVSDYNLMDADCEASGPYPLEVDMISTCSTEGDMVTLNFVVDALDRSTRPTLLPNSRCINIGTLYRAGVMILIPPVSLMDGVSVECACDQTNCCKCTFAQVKGCAALLRFRQSLKRIGLTGFTGDGTSLVQSGTRR